MFLRKHKGGAKVSEYVWENDGDVVDVTAEVGNELLAIDPDGYEYVPAPPDEQAFDPANAVSNTKLVADAKVRTALSAALDAADEAPAQVDAEVAAAEAAAFAADVETVADEQRKAAPKGRKAKGNAPTVADPADADPATKADPAAKAKADAEADAAKVKADAAKPRTPITE